METTTTLNLVLTEASREDDFPAQEQVSGPVPPRDERPAADVLAECLAESATPLFIP